MNKTKYLFEFFNIQSIVGVIAFSHNFGTVVQITF